MEEKQSRQRLTPEELQRLIQEDKRRVEQYYGVTIQEHTPEERERLIASLQEWQQNKKKHSK